MTQAIESKRVGQVVEIAAGLSPRGLRFMSRYAGSDLVYVEGDLPDMAARKLRLLDESDLRHPNHHVAAVDALIDDGAGSLTEICRAHLDPDVGTAFITEGLVNYFDEATTRAMWQRFARLLGEYPAGVYLSDIHLAGETNRLRAARVFKTVLEIFARGEVHLAFDTADDATTALTGAGFDDVVLHRPQDFETLLDLPALRGDSLVRIVEADLPTAQGSRRMTQSTRSKSRS